MPDELTQTQEQNVEATAQASPLQVEIQLPEGGGKQVFRGQNTEQLLEQLVKAQEHATRKIRELNQELKKLQESRGEDAAIPASMLKQPRALSEAELAQLNEIFQQNPAQAVERYVQLQTGYTLTEISNLLNTVRTEIESRQREQRILQAAEEFVERHRDDYYACPENYDALMRYLEAHNMDVTPKSLEVAFQVLSASGLLRKPPSQAVEEQKQARIEQKPRSFGAPILSGSRPPEKVPITEEAYRQFLEGLDYKTLKEKTSQGILILPE